MQLVENGICMLNEPVTYCIVREPRVQIPCENRPTNTSIAPNVGNKAVAVNKHETNTIERMKMHLAIQTKLNSHLHQSYIMNQILV